MLKCCLLPKILSLIKPGRWILPTTYCNNLQKTIFPPVAMWFNYGVLNDFMKEWILRKEELSSGVITRDEYFEWKINWPQTCDGCGKVEPKRQWRICSY